MSVLFTMTSFGLCLKPVNNQRYLDLKSSENDCLMNPLKLKVQNYGMDLKLRDGVDEEFVKVRSQFGLGISEVN